jgi:hypothetical protein
LLDKTARISAFRNATTAVCDTGDGQAVEASFWLFDPPAVSYFTLHCPGLGEDDFSGDPAIVCPEGAFVLFRLTLCRGQQQDDSVYHFIYAAAGKPSLRLLPPPPDPHAQLGLLPCGAVAFLARSWTTRDQAWQSHAYVLSTTTQAWSKKAVASSSEPDSDRPLPQAAKPITWEQARSAGLTSRTALLSSATSSTAALSSNTSPSRRRRRRRRPKPVVSRQNACAMSPAAMVSSSSSR